MYEFLDTLSTVCLLAAAVGAIIGIPCFIMEKIQEKTGFMDPFLRALYGKDWDKQPDFEDEDGDE